MALFACEECGAVDNTALTNYWSQVVTSGLPRYLCSECDPDIAKWHGKFPKQQPERMGYVMRLDGSRIVEPPGGWPLPPEQLAQLRTEKDMSGDRYSICPLCQEAEQIKKLELDDKLKDSYGKIPRDEYKQLEQDIAELKIDASAGPTLREDYEFTLEGKETLISEYGGNCEKCAYNIYSKVTVNLRTGIVMNIVTRFAP